MENPMEIIVFGPGCARCTETENLVKEVAAAKGGDITVEKVTDMKEIMVRGIMSTPAVAVNGVIKSKGKIPTREEIAAWIDGINAPASNACNTQVASALTMKTISAQQPSIFGDTGACCASTAPSSVCCPSAVPSCACLPGGHPDTKKSSQIKEVAIDFLYLDLNTCERCIATGDTLDEALNALAPAFQAMSYTVHVNKVNITTKELAEQYLFISSPTIRVNGMDICTELKESNCKDCGDLCGDSVDCRVFVYEGSEYEQPPAAMLIDGILKVIYGQPSRANEDYTLPDNLERFFAGKKEAIAAWMKGAASASSAPAGGCCGDGSGGKCC